MIPLGKDPGLYSVGIPWSDLLPPSIGRQGSAAVVGIVAVVVTAVVDVVAALAVAFVVGRERVDP